MKRATVLATGAAGLVAVPLLVPGLLYALALARLDRLPTPRYAADDAALASWQACGEGLPLRVEPLDPWTYAYHLTRGDPDSVRRRAGAATAWAIASRYSREHLPGRDGGGGGRRRNPPGSALAIWLTRHWSAEQLARTAAAGAYCQTRPPPHPAFGVAPIPSPAPTPAPPPMEE